MDEAQNDGLLDKMDKAPAQALEKQLQSLDAEIEPKKGSAPDVEDPSKSWSSYLIERPPRR